MRLPKPKLAFSIQLAIAALLTAPAYAVADRILPSVGAKVTPEGLERPTEMPTDEALEAAGAVIGNVEIRITNIFNTKQPEEDTKLFRLANKLHIRTREQTVRTLLLFNPGEKFSGRKLAESERILRKTRFLRAAYVRPVAYHDGRVDIVVLTQDVWTLNPGISFGRKGGKNTSGFQLEELNVLGFGTQLQLGYTSGIDRRSKTIEFNDPQTFGTWWHFNGEYSDNSDGRSSALLLDHPFYSLDTHWAGGVNGFDDERHDSQYDLGHVINKYATHEKQSTGYLGWSSGLHDGWVTRWRAGWTYDLNEFAALTGLTIASNPPPDRKLSYPWIGWQLTEDNYLVTRNRDLIERVEDLYLGWNAFVTLGETQPAFGSDRVSTVFATGVSKGFVPAEAHTLLWSVGATGRYEHGGLANTIGSVSGRYYWRESPKRTFFTSIQVDAGKNLDADTQILLGGDNGLRGYPLRYQAGEGRWLFTAEQRFYTKWFPFRLVNVGAAVFADVGAVWGRNPIGSQSQGTLKDVGFGLRLGNTRTALGNVLHIDVAFPLDGDPSIKNVQLIVETKATF